MPNHFFSRALAIVKTAHSLPVHHSHLSCWQSRGTPLPTTLLPGTPVANANGHILGKSSTPPIHLIDPKKDIRDIKTVGLSYDNTINAYMTTQAFPLFSRSNHAHENIRTPYFNFIKSICTKQTIMSW